MLFNSKSKENIPVLNSYHVLDVTLSLLLLNTKCSLPQLFNLLIACDGLVLPVFTLLAMNNMIISFLDGCFSSAFCWKILLETFYFHSYYLIYDNKGLETPDELKNCQLQVGKFLEISWWNLEKAGLGEQINFSRI